MESQLSRETSIESNILPIISNQFRMNNNLLKKYQNFKELKKIPINLTWEEMKGKYNWGYRKGSIIDPLITWIYLRPDISKDLDGGRFEAKDLVKYFRLNEHYFIVEQKAVEYLKLNCSGYLEENEENSEEDSEEDCEDNKSVVSSELSYQTLKRRKLYTSAPIGIDDMAIDSRNSK